MWVGRLFYIPAFAGGIFGLLGGYLTDRSAAAACSPGASCCTRSRRSWPGFSTSIEMLLVLRCLVFIGVCVEFVAAVAWLAELFPDPKRREKVLGYTQAFSSLGGLLVATVNGLVRRYASACRPSPTFGRRSWAARAVALHADVGRDPRDSADLIRPFLPESPDLAAEEGRRHAQAAEHRRAVRARAAPDDDRDHGDVRVQLRRRVRRDPADAADRARACPRCGRWSRGRRRLERAGSSSGVAADVTKVQEIGGLVGRVPAGLARGRHRQPPHC